MMMLSNYILFIFIGCSLVWRTLDFAWIARSPFRIAAVGLVSCAFGFYLQLQVHRAESIPASVLLKIPLLAVDHDALIFIDRLVDVVVYAVGAGIIASAFFLRTQLRFEKEKRNQLKIQENSSRNIAELEQDLKFVDVDVKIYRRGTAQERRELLFRIIKRERRTLEKSTRILEKMGVF